MTKIDWGADRRRRMAAEARRASYLEIMTSEILNKGKSVISAKKKKRRRRRSRCSRSNTARCAKAKSRTEFKFLAPDIHKTRAYKRVELEIQQHEQMLEQRRIDFRAERAAGVIRYPSRQRVQNFTVEYTRAGS